MPIHLPNYGIVWLTLGCMLNYDPHDDDYDDDKGKH